MLASIFILTVSVILFHYWFRYTCLLILSTRTTKDYSAQVAEQNQMSFLHVQQLLKQAAGESLESLEKSLQRDYRLVTYLCQHAAEFQVGGESLEQKMLRIDYRMMKAVYSVARLVSESKARAALEEMAQIVGYFANSFGEKVASSARA